MVYEYGCLLVPEFWVMPSITTAVNGFLGEKGENILQVSPWLMPQTSDSCLYWNQSDLRYLRAGMDMTRHALSQSSNTNSLIVRFQTATTSERSLGRIGPMSCRRHIEGGLQKYTLTAIA